MREGEVMTLRKLLIALAKLSPEELQDHATVRVEGLGVFPVHLVETNKGNDILDDGHHVLVSRTEEG
tara:strand:- start:263 stop:463 length:201 start_codon:yes stop_codon:yes gene_type:complete